MTSLISKLTEASITANLEMMQEQITAEGLVVPKRTVWSELAIANPDKFRATEFQAQGRTLVKIELK